MAGPKTYVGVSGKARLVKNIYVGVSEKARKVKKAYVGVGGMARLVYSSDFWLPTGVAAANCLAAYQFKGATSETEALTDRTGHGYTLTKSGSPSWASAGFTIPAYGGLNNTTLRDKSPVTVIARFDNFNPAKNQIGGSSYQAAIVYESNDRATRDYQRLYLSTSYATHSFYWVGSGALGYQNGVESTIRTLSTPYTENIKNSGVVGVSFGGSLYYNGTAQSVIKPTFKVNQDGGTGEITACLGNAGYVIGMCPKTDTWCGSANQGWASYRLQAIAFYSVSLSAAQHSEVYTAMMQL